MNIRVLKAIDVKRILLMKQEKTKTKLFHKHRQAKEHCNLFYGVHPKNKEYCELLWTDITNLSKEYVCHKEKLHTLEYDPWFLKWKTWISVWIMGIMQR